MKLGVPSVNGGRLHQSLAAEAPSLGWSRYQDREPAVERALVNGALGSTRGGGAALSVNGRELLKVGEAPREGRPRYQDRGTAFSMGLDGGN